MGGGGEGVAYPGFPVGAENMLVVAVLEFCHGHPLLEQGAKFIKVSAKSVLMASCVRSGVIKFCFGV